MTIIAYIAGPFRAPTAWGIAQNVRHAEEIGLMVAQAGAMPLIPHANTANFHGEGSDQLWLDGTLELMRRCDVVVLTPDWQRSSGARAERDEAERIGLPIFDCSKHEPNALIAALSRWLITHGPGSPAWSAYCAERLRAFLPMCLRATGIVSTDPPVEGGHVLNVRTFDAPAWERHKAGKAGLAPRADD